ncbi:endopeptidase La [Bacteroidales bacterium OttesenSCG-928-B11]|nr:endopeptidase La [Bacteroidales bacterium OttesenSCG-928-E04]MDL2308140.1 endopeptidase La [Bacteroidales bacterium OttesenSCG-928-C03]MDL2311505.1 endopeptidase La [Bacteroidales bacterium OttesenSCG-928-B11]MDL2325566.1 endopeptidase La [Bacteroidales bacterium OttesenSCG-928-A14]
MDTIDDKFLINDFMNNDANIIPLFSKEDEDALKDELLPDSIPILPLRNTVLFPGMVIPITVGRNRSIKLVQDYARSNHPIGVATQREGEVEEPTIEDLYPVGTLARIIRHVSMPDGSVTIIVQGVKRFAIEELTQLEPYFKALVREYPTNDFDTALTETENFKALIGSIRDTAIAMIKMSPNIPNETSFALKNMDSPVFLLNYLASNLSASVNEKQEILETQDIELRAKMILRLLNKDLQLLELKNMIQHKSKQEMDKQQREYFLNEQMKTIQQELGGSPADKAIEDLQEKAKKKKWSKDIRETFENELQKLERTNPMAPDFSVQLNYLELMVDLPWNEYSKDNFDLKRARKVLDQDHFGLEKVKERIIEHLAILKLKGDMKSPILCLAGPPGVGKTSLGKSIAAALDRKYIRVSLGGLRDESEIRGHRKTYIGAMAGRIIQNMRKAKTSNPVFVLDEIDKVLGMNVQGDPSAALLEVLDPEQNSAFHDNYLELPYDLSKVLFIATANDLSSIHPALRDRMEIIDIPGYLLEEKIQIAQKHLVPKQLREHGMEKKGIVFSDEVIEHIVSDYTRESGVRTLDRTIAKIIRSRAAKYVQDGVLETEVTLGDLKVILGAPIFQKERSIDNDVPGVATGLAWTPVGGEILFVESVTSMGKGGLTLTGNLGDVMKESATIAYEYIKSHAKDYSINPDIFETTKVHVHVPEGATPKDGPSAGITILTSLVSSFTQKKVRGNIAMTGEITLRGKLLPVGGIKEKILAAKRAGIYDIVLSTENKKDIDDIKENFVDGLSFHYFETMKEAVGYTVMK